MAARPRYEFTQHPRRQLGSYCHSASLTLGVRGLYCLLFPFIIAVTFSGGCAIPSHRLASAKLPVGACSHAGQNEPTLADAPGTTQLGESVNSPGSQGDSDGGKLPVPPPDTTLGTAGSSEPGRLSDYPANSADAGSPGSNEDCTTRGPLLPLPRFGFSLGWNRHLGHSPSTYHDIPESAPDRTDAVPRARFHPVPTRPVFQPQIGRPIPEMLSQPFLLHSEQPTQAPAVSNEPAASLARQTIR